MIRASALLVCLTIASAVRAEAIPLPGGTELKVVNFERHIVPLLATMGCNAGACHGSFQGKGGFTLSLFGHDPAQDFLAITHDGMGRRITRPDPDRSLILLKATAQIPHGGGKRFDKRSWQHAVIRQWIAQGCSRDADSGAIARMDVTPQEHLFERPGQTISLSVTATFRDGTHAEVTPFCDFRVKDDSIAVVSVGGEVRASKPGDTPVIVSYRGNLATARVLVPTPKLEGFAYAATPEMNRIDTEVFSKLRRLNLVPSQLSGDSEFLRRITLDTIGALPGPDDVRAFLADRNPAKRSHKIDELLHHPLHAALWATKLCDITGANVDEMDGSPELRTKRAKMWHDWFRRRIANNVPYDQIVRGVLCSTSREGRDLDHWIADEIRLDRAAHDGFDTPYADRETLDLFWRRTGSEDFFPLESMAERTAAAFLGVRLECAQCHKHPYDRWTQTDYRAFANIFAQVQFGSSPETTAAADSLLNRRRALPLKERGPAIPRLQEIYLDNHLSRRLPDPKTQGILSAKALGGPEIDYSGDAREQLFRWMTGPGSSHFARAFVNRVWALYFGAGLVDPVDGISVANPASNERLLDWLVRDFITNGYDLRKLEYTILNSNVYQLSAVPNASNGEDHTNWSHAQPRRLMAEVVLDVLNDALGTEEDFTSDAPRGARAIQVASNRVASEGANRIFRVFGRPTRTATCDCERHVEPAVPQTLFMMSDPAVLKKIESGRLKTLLATTKTDQEVLEELFLATLSRLPGKSECAAALGRMRESADRRSAFVEILWALINTREFILNH